MRSLIATEKQDGKRIDRILRDTYDKMPASAMYKAFRKKDIKVNGKRVKEDHTVHLHDKIEVYISDDILDGKPLEGTFKLNRGFSVVYEDTNLLLVNKEPGVPVHPDRDTTDDTLIQRIQSYLQQKGEYNPDLPGTFPPSLCHRLDRNTGGLVLIARNEIALKTLLEKLENREIKKYYQCLVQGNMEKPQAELRDYLVKDERKSRVFIDSRKAPGALEIVTRYRVLASDGERSRLEVELVTGRTHQIRAHLAFIGHPILGDGKYGLNSINRPLGLKYQQLWACRIVFDFRGSSPLDYLKGKAFEVSPHFDLTDLG